MGGVRGTGWQHGACTWHTPRRTVARAIKLSNLQHRDPGPDSGAAVSRRQSVVTSLLSCSVSNRNIKTGKQAKICCTIFCPTQCFGAAKNRPVNSEFWVCTYWLQQIECSLLNAGHHFSFQHWVNDQLPVCELSAAAAPESPRRLAATGDWRGQSVGDTRWLCDGGMLAWCGSWCRAGACCQCARWCREVGGGGGAWRADPGPVPAAARCLHQKTLQYCNTALHAQHSTVT